jgi:hypothetical protein
MDNLPLVGRLKNFEHSEKLFGWGTKRTDGVIPHPTCSLRCARRPPHGGEVKTYTYLTITNPSTSSTRNATSTHSM